MSTEKLSRRQVELVLRRAAEIDTTSPHDAPARVDEAELSVGDMMKLGDEAGLRPASIARALGELRRGVALEPEEGTMARALGPGRIVVTRVVPGGVEPVRRAVDRFMREQLMAIRRHHGERIEWERAQGLWPGLLRSLSFTQRYAFAQVSHIETVVTAETDDTTSVTFLIDVREMRREHATRMTLGASAAFMVIGLGGAAVIPGFGVNDILALASGGAAAGGVFAVGRRRFLGHRERVALAPERFLDLLVQRRRRSTPDEE